jgi:EAL domain-containing protein (putative c-di-GMP-specific phosphodiesterase class I)
MRTANRVAGPGLHDFYVQARFHARTETISGLQAYTMHRLPGHAAVPLGMVSSDRAMLLLDFDCARRVLGKIHNISLTHPELPISLCLTPAFLHDPEFAHFLRKQMAELSMDPASLVLEFIFTPDMAMQGIPQANIENLQDAGIQITAVINHLDQDVSLLANLSINKAKLDRMLTAKVSTKYMQPLSLIITRLRNKGMSLVADGIETRSQLATLVEMGVSEVQGNLLAGAGPAQSVLEALPDIPVNLLTMNRDLLHAGQS